MNIIINIAIAIGILLESTLMAPTGNLSRLVIRLVCALGFAYEAKKINLQNYNMSFLSSPLKVFVGFFFCPITFLPSHLINRRKILRGEATLKGDAIEKSLDEIARISALKDSGDITEEEFLAQKTELLA